MSTNLESLLGSRWTNEKRKREGQNRTSVSLRTKCLALGNVPTADFGGRFAPKGPFCRRFGHKFLSEELLLLISIQSRELNSSKSFSDLVLPITGSISCLIKSLARRQTSAIFESLDITGFNCMTKGDELCTATIWRISSNFVNPQRSKTLPQLLIQVLCSQRVHSQHPSLTSNPRKNFNKYTTSPIKPFEAQGLMSRPVMGAPPMQRLSAQHPPSMRT